MPRKRETVLQDRFCFACGETFETHKPKATRCPSCIAEGRKAQRKRCAGCDKQTYTPDLVAGMCKSCSGQGVTRMARDFNSCSDQAVPRVMPDDHLEQLKQDRAIRRQRNLDRLKERIAQWSKPPKGMKTVTSLTRDIPVNILWRDLCFAEGSTTVLLSEAVNLTDEEKERMSLLFLRLRMKGFRTQQLVDLDAAHILGLEDRLINEAISEMATVEEDDAQGEEDLDPFEGLSPEQRGELEAFLEIRQRDADARMLGLAN